MTPDGPEKSRRGRKRGEKAGRVRYWQYGQAEKSSDLAISDLSRFLALRQPVNSRWTED